MRTFEDLYTAVYDLPIVDLHNHLDIAMLERDAPLGSLYEVWVKDDLYKHRAMRICGEPEALITGNVHDVRCLGGETARWEAWMRTLPKLVGSPVFAWAKMELEILGIDAGPYLRGNGMNISLANWTPSRLFKEMNIETVCPCMGPKDVNVKDARSSSIIPSLRINAGEVVADKMLAAFSTAGCRIVDISVDDDDDLERHFYSLAKVAVFAAANGWTMLLHLGALRETSARLRELAGPVGGYDGMRAPVDPAKVARFLARLENFDEAVAPGVSCANGLPRTILLTANPEAYAQLAVLSGSFNEEGIPGKVQLGPAWCWCDHEEGIRDMLEKNAAYGVLSTFVGMTTDSRSLLSLVRHYYFRQVLCQWVAEKIETGTFPEDDGLICLLLEKVCYLNARMILESHRDDNPAPGAVGALSC